MPFGVAAAAIGAAGAVAGGMMQAKGAKDAANAQKDSQALQIAQKDKALAEGQAYLSPYETIGSAAQNKLANMLGIATPFSVPDRNAFMYTDTLGTQRFNEAGYRQAMNDFGNQAAQYGFVRPTAPDQRAYKNAKGQLMKKAWAKALSDYNLAKTKFYQDIQSPEAQAKIRQAQMSAPESGSLLHDFNAQDYQNDPTYTPFVNTLEDLQKTPGYDFRLKQGEQSLNRQAAANGGLLSGAAMKAMNRYGQDYASNEYQSAWDRAQTAFGNAFNRYNQNRTQKYNMFAGQGQQGMQAASGMAGNAMNSGAQGVQIAQNTGDNLSSIKLAQGNAWGNAIQGAANSVAGGVVGYGINKGGWGTGSMTPEQAGISGPMKLSSQT